MYITASHQVTCLSWNYGLLVDTLVIAYAFFLTHPNVRV